jgi:flavodoxin
MRVLIMYFSPTGMTAKMAEYIAEGVRFSGHDAMVKKVEDVKNAAELTGFDGYIFGSPTYSLDIPEPMKTLLSALDKIELEGKLGGAFGTYTHDVSYKHDTHAPAIVLDILQNKYKMEPFELGAFVLKEDVVETREGMKTCQDYGRVFGEKLIGKR